MNISEDNARYEILHEGLLRGLFASVNHSLKEAKEHSNLSIPDEWMEGVVETIVFGIATTLDGSASNEHEGHEVIPHLTFKNAHGSKELLVNDSGSYLHEMVMGYLDELDLDEL